MPKFAANLTMMFQEVPFLERFAAASQAGFEAVEFLFPYDYAADEIAALLKANNLRNVLFNMPPGDWANGERGIASFPDRVVEFREGVGKAIDYAMAIGTPRLHIMAGLRPAGADADVLRRTFVQNLRFAAGECARHGIEVMIEPINQRDMPGYLLSRQADAHAIREEVGATNLKVQMDFYHVQIMEGDIATTFRKFQPHIGHVQIAGVPERHEPNTGELDYRYLFSLLDDLGYDGWVGCEYRPAHNTVEGLKWMSDLTGSRPEATLSASAGAAASPERQETAK